MHPVAFNLGQLSIRWYGILVGLGFMLGLWTASRRAVRSGVEAEKILDLGPWLILGAIIGARTLYVASYWREQFADKPIWEILMVHHGGLVYYGGLVGSSLAFILYARFKGLPPWQLADILAPSIALGYALGRMGCLMNGCCYGRQCALPWAIHFPPDHPTYPNGVHPTQVYESLTNLLLYAALAWLYRRKRFNGQVFAGYLIGYAVSRSFVEMFRGDYPQDQRFFGGWLTPAHVVSILIFAAGLVLLRVLSPKPAANRP